MSFRKFGGTNKLEKNNNITAHSIVADNFTIRNAFLSVFTIDGDLKINGNGFISKSIIANVSLQTASLDVSLNATIDGNLYLDKQKTTFFNGNNYMIGLNKSNPSATLDIVSSQIGALNIKSSINENRNIIARNMWNHGIAVDVAGNTLAAIQFYSGTNNIDLSNNSNAKISYENVGNVLVINSDGGTKITSNLIIADSDSVSNTHTAYDETVLIYDKPHANPTFFIESYGQTTVKTGSAVTIQAIDSSSNTYMNIVTPNRLGLNIGGGAYPSDITRSMGIIDVYNPVTGSLNDDVATPAQIIISGNTFTKFNATTGFNTFNPNYNKYAVDINGPVHLNNGEIKMTITTENRIVQILPLNTSQRLFAIGGYDGTTAASSRKYIYNSSDGGKSWEKLGESIDSGGVLQTNVNIILKMYTVSQIIVVVGNENSFVRISINLGANWFSVTNFTGIPNIQSVYISEFGLNLCLGGNDGTVIIGTLNSGTYSFNVTPVPYTEIKSARGSASNSITDSARCNAGVDRLFFVGGKYIYSYSLDGGGTTLGDFTNNSTSSVSTAAYKKIKFNGAIGIAVGTNVISYTTDSGTNWTHYDITGVTLNDVHILGTNSQAIVVGNDGKMYYTSNTGYAVWILIDIEIINSSGIGSTIINSTNNITSVNMTDSSTILLSIVKNNDGGAYKSKLFYLNMPNIFNRSENHILDISGCIHTSGDIHISEKGKLISNNTEFYMINETVGNLYLAGDAKLIKIGSTKTGNVIVGGNNTLTKLGPLIIGNLYQGNVRIDNNLIIGNLYSMNISNIGDTNIIGNIIANNIIVGNATLSGIELINNTMASTSTNTGALVVSGGVGIGGNINTSGILTTSGKIVSTDASTPTLLNNQTYVSGNGPITSLEGRSVFGNIHVARNAYFDNMVTFYGDITVVGTINGTINVNVQNIAIPFDAVSTNDIDLSDPFRTDVRPSISVQGGLLVKKNSYIVGNITIISTYESSTTATGALQVSGGLGIGKNVNIGGNAMIYSTIESATTDTGALQILGGIGIKKNANIGGSAVIYSTTESNNTDTGAVKILGGIGIAKNTNIGGNALIDGNAVIYSTTESDSTAAGAIRTLGGIGIAKNAQIGGNVVIYSTTESATTATGALQILGGLGIAKNANSGGNAVIYSTTESNATDSGAIETLGGIGIAKNANIGGNTKIYSTAESTTTATGAVQILGGIGISKSANIGGNVLIYSTTESTTTATGALQILGGIGIAKNSNIGGNTLIGGNALIYSTTESNTTDAGSIRTLGGIGIAKNANIGGITKIYSTTESATTAAGALQILGGIGISKNANIGGNTLIYSTAESTTTATGALQILGGVGIAKHIHIGGNAVIYSTAESTTTSTGALQISGGVGIGKNVNIGGNVIINSTANSTSITSGALQILGGVGVTGNMYIGGNTQLDSLLASSLFVLNNITSNKLFAISTDPVSNPSNGALVVTGGFGLGGSMHAGGNVLIYSTFESTSTDSGALIVAGGIGINKNSHIGGNVIIYSNTESNNVSTGALRIAGGAGVTRNLNVGSALNVTGISTLTGATISGGASISGALNVGSNTTIVGTLRVTGISTLTGATISGGASVSGALNVGSNSTIVGTLAVTGISTLTGATISGGASVSGALNVGSNSTIVGTLVVGNSTTIAGSLRVTGTSVVQNESVLGSASIAGTLNVAGTTTLQATTVAGAFNIGSSGVTSSANGTIIITANTASNSTNSGALQIRGGLGVNGTVTALAFNAVSDVRTKTNINDLNNSGLETLRKLKPKEFSYIDGARDSVYGFIAQEIREVIPKSVIIQPNYIPSIYEYAMVHAHANTNKITLINKTTIDMAGCKLRIHDKQNNHIIVNVIEVIDNKTFVIDENISSHLTSIDLQGNRLETKTIDGVVRYVNDSQEYNGEVQMGIFIYGIYVEDFHVLNKDTIWTVALIATQEMDLQLQDARKNIRTLEDRITEIERRLS